VCGGFWLWLRRDDTTRRAGDGDGDGVGGEVNQSPLLHCIGGGLGWANGVPWAHAGEWHCRPNEHLCYVTTTMWTEIMMADTREIRCRSDIFKPVSLYPVSADAFESIAGSRHLPVDSAAVRKVVVGLLLLVRPSTSGPCHGAQAKQQIRALPSHEQRLSYSHLHHRHKPNSILWVVPLKMRCGVVRLAQFA
jgi:hypothetical protein